LSLDHDRVVRADERVGRIDELAAASLVALDAQSRLAM
jgi:hypothetical protein